MLYLPPTDGSVRMGNLEAALRGFETLEVREDLCMRNNKVSRARFVRWCVMRIKRSLARLYGEVGEHALFPHAYMRRHFDLFLYTSRIIIKRIGIVISLYRPS
jgi:hypothetical protein